MKMLEEIKKTPNLLSRNKGVKKMTERERLIEILSMPIYPRIGADPAEVVADFLLDNGVIVPPCKIGDVVYNTTFSLTHGHRREITECKVSRFDPVSNGLVIVVVTTEHLMKYDIRSEEFGKTTFFNREEAEAAMKERDEK